MKMPYAACCLAYFGFLRIGELTVPSDNWYDASCHLSWGDVAVDVIPLTQLEWKCIGKVASGLCPVSAMLAYLVVRQSPLSHFAMENSSQDND